MQTCFSSIKKWKLDPCSHTMKGGIVLLLLPGQPCHVNPVSSSLPGGFLEGREELDTLHELLSHLEMLVSKHSGTLKMGLDPVLHQLDEVAIVEFGRVASPPLADAPISISDHHDSAPRTVFFVAPVKALSSNPCCLLLTEISRIDPEAALLQLRW